MTRARDTADTQDNLGGAVAPFVAGKNFIINGGFDIWQRSTSGTIAAGSYVAADRWYTYRGVAGSTFSRQSASLTGFQYLGRLARDSGNTSTTNISCGQSIESINSIPLAGQTVVFSFWAKAGANYSATSSILRVRLLSSTTTDQNIVLNGGVTVIDQNITLTTSWQRFSYSAAVGSTAVTLGGIFSYDPTGTAGANDYFEITGVQLELGSAATPFARAGGSIGGELALCQRYYYRNSATGTNTTMGFGFASSSTNVMGVIQFPVTMRVQPSSIDFSTIQCNDSATGTAVSAVAFAGTEIGTQLATVNFTTSGMTTYRPTKIISNGSTAGYLGFSAEL